MINNRISILIPTYEMRGKGYAFLNQCLRSIVTQDYSHFEVIISDNSESQYLSALWRNYLDKGLDIKYYYNPTHKGISANFNYGLQFCTGSIVKPIFQDDFLDSENCLTELNKAVNQFDNEWFALSYHVFKNQIKSPIFNPHWTDDILKGNNKISAPSVIAFRNRFKDNFLMDEQLILHSDIDWYYRLYAKYGQPFFITTATVGINDGDHNTQHHITGEQGLSERKLLEKKYNVIL